MVFAKPMEDIPIVAWKTAQIDAFQKEFALNMAEARPVPFPIASVRFRKTGVVIAIVFFV